VFRATLAKAGIDISDWPEFDEHANWPGLRERFTTLFASRTRAQWCEVLEGSDSCFAPVLAPAEAASHPHNRARRTFVEIGGVTQPAPAPRFSRTAPALPDPPGAEGAAEWARDWGVDAQALAHCGYDPT